MQCEFNYCVYNQHEICTLEIVQINAACMCEECLMVEIPEKELDELKRKLLKELDEVE